MLNDMTYITFHCRYGQLSIHRGCIEKMGKPVYIQILVNPEVKQLLLRISDEQQKNSFAVSERLYSAKADFGINGVEMVEKFRKLMGWKKQCAYRVEGTLIDNHMMHFKLDTATGSDDWNDDSEEAEECLISID